MKTKPYIIDDVIYHVPEKVAEAISEMHSEIYDNRAVKKELQQELNQLLEDYKELWRENTYFKRILDNDGYVKIKIPDVESPEDETLDREYYVHNDVKVYLERIYKVVEGMEREIEILVEESVAQ